MAVEDLYDKACEAGNKGNYGYAIELYREVLRIDPEYEEARRLLRGIERRRYEENYGFLYLAMAWLRGLWPLAKAYAQFNKPRKRLESCEDFLELIPNYKHVLLMAGKAARRCGLDEASTVLFHDVLAQDEENETALRALGEAYQEDGETGKALKYLGRLSDLKPEDRQLQARVKNMEAEAHMQKTQMDEAESFRDMIKDEEFAEEAERKFDTEEERRAKELEEAEKELEREPENINKIVRVADLYEEEGRIKEAIQLLDKARKRMPGNYQIRERLGDVRLEMYDRTLKKVDRKLEENPDDEELRKKRDKFESKRKQLAIQEYEWRIKQHPTDNDLRLKLGYAYYDAGKINDALGAFQKAARDSRLRVEAAGMMGRCFLDKEQYDLAVEQLERAIDEHGVMDEKGMKLRYELALALEKSGDEEEALRIYKKIYSNDIGFRDVAEKVDSLSQ